MDIQKELSQHERDAVAQRLAAEQRMRFRGQKKASYTAAGVNSETWNRVTRGERIRPDRLVHIVTSLWPESEGDWSRIPQDRRQGEDGTFDACVSRFRQHLMAVPADRREVATEAAVQALYGFVTDAQLDSLLESLEAELKRRGLDQSDPSDTTKPQLRAAFPEPVETMDAEAEGQGE